MNCNFEFFKVTQFADIPPQFTYKEKDAEQLK